METAAVTAYEVEIAKRNKTWVIGGKSEVWQQFTASPDAGSGRYLNRVIENKLYRSIGINRDPVVVKI